MAHPMLRAWTAGDFAPVWQNICQCNYFRSAVIFVMLGVFVALATDGVTPVQGSTQDAYEPSGKSGQSLPAGTVAQLPTTSPNTSAFTNPMLIHVPGDVANLQDAITQVIDGGIIEMASGTYPVPAGGFVITNLGKAFTIRAASGAVVTLDGASATSIVRFINSTVGAGGPVVFQGLTFAHGVSTTDGLAGGVTLQNAQATFINCSFQSNTGNQPSTGGGGILVAINSTAFFSHCTWNANTDRNYGGGLAVEANSRAYVFSSVLTNNRTNLPGHLQTAAGGGIHVGNSVLRVANTRFDSNQAGYVGGGIYGIGNWNTPILGTPTNILVANSTFINNRAIRDASVSFPLPTEGGAFHAEDQTTANIYNSRFIMNSAMVGGGLNLYRSTVTVEGSVFQGNAAFGTGAANGFGGAISATSNDTTADGSNNWPSANLTLTNAVVQGRYGSVTNVAQSAGGLYAAGDYNSTYGANGVSQRGTVTANRATVTLNGVVFIDLDVQEASGVPGTGVGGGIVVDLVNLTLQNSLVAGSDAIGNTNSSGGAMAILDQSSVNVSGSSIIHNTSGLYGAGIFAQGSSVNISNSNLVENALGNVGSNAANSFGAAVFSSPDSSRNLPVTGVVANNIISNNTGLPIFDDDRQPGPINDVRYNGNQIYSSTFGNQIYTDSIPFYCCKTVSDLNTLVITRSGGPSTTKSDGTNSALGTPAIVGKILAIPPQLLSQVAWGDSAGPTSYLGYGWSGGSASVDGSSVAGNGGLKATATLGTHTLSVGGSTFTAILAQGATPTISFGAAPSGGSSYMLSWNTTAGTFLDIAIDQGVSIVPAASGSVTVSNAPRMYSIFLLTEEGGDIRSAIVMGPPLIPSGYLPFIRK